MPHVQQIIIDVKEGPPKFEERMAIDMFSVGKRLRLRIQRFNHIFKNQPAKSPYLSADNELAVGSSRPLLLLEMSRLRMLAAGTAWCGQNQTKLLKISRSSPHPELVGYIVMKDKLTGKVSDSFADERTRSRWRFSWRCDKKTRQLSS